MTTTPPTDPPDDAECDEMEIVEFVQMLQRRFRHGPTLTIHLSSREARHQRPVSGAFTRPVVGDATGGVDAAQQSVGLSAQLASTDDEESKRPYVEGCRDVTQIIWLVDEGTTGPRYTSSV